MDSYHFSYFCQNKGDVMVVYLSLLEDDGCYGCINNSGEALINKHTQSIVCSVTIKTSCILSTKVHHYCIYKHALLL